MRNLYAIYRKEMGHYFVSPIAYIVAGVFLILCGYFFNYFLAAAVRASFAREMQGMQLGMPSEFDVPGQVLRAFFSVLGSLMLFLMPMLTMGVYSEECKRGTMELLMTSPLTDAQIVIGKFLASLSLFFLMMLPTVGYQFFLFHYSEPAPPWRLILAGYLGAAMLASVLLAIGSFISSLTESQLIAAVLTFGVILILWVIDLSGRGSNTAAGAIFQYCSVIRHYDDFTRGIIDTSSLVFYASLAGLGLFLTVRAVDSMRWRRA